MKTEKKNNSISIAAAGFMAIAVILIVGTFVLGRVAGNDTKVAVRNVSLLYLSELAGRREQVVSSVLDDYIRDLDVAVGMLGKSDLASRENLQSYQFRMKQLYDLDKFAFVDSEGVIYTSRGTRSDIDQYELDYMNLSEPKILIKNLHSNDKKVVIAVPVDNLHFLDKTLVVSFMEIDMDVLLRNVSIQSNNNTTFCNIYTSDGVALTDMVLGGLASEDNLLEAMRRAEYENGYSHDKVVHDFDGGRSGEVSFSYNGISETLYYVPIHGTEWMLTYLIRESIIGEQINSISESIIFRGVFQSALTALVLLAMFIILMFQQKKAAGEALEREVAEAENKVRQQELEEQLAMQEELASKSEELFEALRLAEDASRAKSDFVSHMSHEIRTPITAILGMNEMIRRESDNESILSYADNISSAGESLLRTISDILDFSKIEAGHMELDVHSYSTAELMGDLYNLIRLRAEGKGLKLIFNIDRAIPRGLRGDGVRLKQIVTNLLSNAVKYTEKGEVCLEVIREKTEPDMSSVTLRFVVSDTGIGIKSEEMDKLFVPFDRLDVSKTRSIEGTGLGLSISRQLLHLMDSELMVESIYGKGSKFYFSIRQEISDPEAMGDYRQKERQNTEKEEQKYFTAPGRRILIVDDIPMNLQVLTGLLKRTEMIVETASGGEECLRLFGQKDYDIVFMDYRMPGMDGIETLHRLRKMYPDKAGSTPVIALTASAILGDRERLLQEGFTAYLSKPVIIREMEDMLRSYLGEAKDGGTAGGQGGGAQVAADESGGHVRGIADEPAGKPHSFAGGQGSDAQGAADESRESAGGFAGGQGGDAEEIPREILDIPGLDCETGLKYCGDAEFYIFALQTYAESVDEKSASLESCLKENRPEDYTIIVHSLKSMSRSIGAVSLSDKAAALERAGSEGNLESLKDDTESFIKEYRALGERLRSYFG